VLEDNVNDGFGQTLHFDTYILALIADIYARFYESFFSQRIKCRMEGFPSDIFQFVLPTYIICPFDIVACSQVSREWRRVFVLSMRWKKVWDFLNGTGPYARQSGFIIFPFDITHVEDVYFHNIRRQTSLITRRRQRIDPYEKRNICNCTVNQMCFFAGWSNICTIIRGEGGDDTICYNTPGCASVYLCSGPLPIATIKRRICILAGCRCSHSKVVGDSRWVVEHNASRYVTNVKRIKIV
jgi:hypothetical protein